MNFKTFTRRDILQTGGAAVTGLTLIPPHWIVERFLHGPAEEVIPWVDQPSPNPAPEVIGKLQLWEDLQVSMITPTEKFFSVAHYEGPLGPPIDSSDWHLEITGSVRHPLSLTLDDLRSRPRNEVIYTLECAGNHGLPGFSAGIGTAKWSGTLLTPLLQQADIMEEGIEVVFFGSDMGEEEIRGEKMIQNFARSMSLSDVMDSELLLCYEMNDRPLAREHGYPLRLIAPGWYGIANVKWLKRIEIRKTRFMGRFMARDYVTIRGEQRDGEMAWMESSVGRSLLKSVPARVIRNNGQYRISGAAWGAPIRSVEVQIDGGSWMSATLDQNQDAPYAWKFWSLDWRNPQPGEHSITSRAIDIDGNVQPAADDPGLINKRTYWESNGQVSRKIMIT
jgi:DMSO/TMAO reductase YedYZ molybdopterin-dependent catalytic subunit